MSSEMLKTWTICFIIAITVANLGLGGPLPESQDILEGIPNTTLDVILQKFPSLDKNKLNPNLVDILNITCADWRAINSTNSLTKPGIINAQCLVLYESLAAFCSSFGDSLPKYLKYIPSLVPKKLKITIQNICVDDQGLYSLKDGEHNISNLLQSDTKPMNCYFLCSGFGEKGDLIIHDTCKYSYFFTSFEAAKFLGDINLRSNVLAQNETAPQQAKADLPEAALVQNKAVQTPNQTVIGAAKPQAGNGNQKDASVMIEAPSKTINLKESPEKIRIVAGKPAALAEKPDVPAGKSDALADEPDASEVNVDSVAGNADSVAGNADSVAGNADSVVGKLADKSDSVANKPKKIADAVAEMPAVVAENPLEAEDKKNIPAPKDDKAEAPVIAENNNSLEGNANQDEMEDEEAELNQEEADGKAEPVMPEEIAEVKTPSIKGKPNTVEDEPISSYNIPEDEMDGDSYFFSYFTVLMCLVIVGYVGYHNRQKILALVLEGKRGKRSGRQARRPNSSNYHKLDSNLEEAISSSCTKNASNVIY